MEDEEENVIEENDGQKYYNYCRDDIRENMPEQTRRKAADIFGENWASILSGLGDQ